MTRTERQLNDGYIIRNRFYTTGIKADSHRIWLWNPNEEVQSHRFKAHIPKTHFADLLRQGKIVKQEDAVFSDGTGAGREEIYVAASRAI
jgi:hypothetical protein